MERLQRSIRDQSARFAMQEGPDRLDCSQRVDSARANWFRRDADLAIVFVRMLQFNNT
jgi:hypothetical protein